MALVEITLLGSGSIRIYVAEACSRRCGCLQSNPTALKLHFQRPEEVVAVIRSRGKRVDVHIYPRYLNGRHKLERHEVYEVPLDVLNYIKRNGKPAPRKRVRKKAIRV